MSLAVTIDLRDEARPHFRRVVQNLERGDVRRVMGRAIATTLRKHFTRRDEAGNRLGGQRTHFWGQVRRSVQQPQLIGGDGVQVAINHVAFAQKVFGGDIAPVDAEWLTVPARSEAHGHRAREFNDLHAVFFSASLGALVQNDQTSLGGRVDGSITPTRRKQGGEIGGLVFYWLVEHVHQEPDPEALPPETELRDAALQAGADYLQTLDERGGRN
ncbi:MAG: hypothetical protein HZA93_29350 [Verrucomicrobia bacterium]|nr:hypothetical protein [Verrucomicrobiota bacterium]